ncbi:hypothetical protein BBK36DRAFT_1174437 [Trichoderma citrinoviride]|uniref:RRM domain-containing protein n=1 Tax=Trichoderma citrinoviride TaxID=58853 RepID=A0A2T4BMD6_9HYPO|nr:hypothetical protein BBK36DRAFT_1174437 [Trichoderma citrinoviride]PTB70485.1 hypothetical protein BBK36DRAFT_1174437 [Trichoderma citrinoviride]
MPAHSSLRHPKKTLLKASSFDVLRQLAFDTENAFSPGMKRPLSSIPLPSPKRPASSGNLIDQITKCGEQESSLAFQVGNASKYDVFTDRPTSGTDYKDSSSKGTDDSIEEPSPEASRENGSWALVSRQPPSVDAQNIYPSSACVFVANLTQAFDDRKLEIEVTKCFSQYGTVFVKIRRDSRQMPFAFCQFTCDADAENAAHHGNGAIILGRPCRVEKATANSCFVVYKLSGAETTRQEAIDLLGSLGTIAKVHPLDLNSQKTDRFPSAMVVHYKRYDSSRAVVKTFEEHPVFRVEAYDPKAELRQQHKRSDQQIYAQYEKDRRSAYFGNLPLNMTTDVLKTLASQCGSVLCADVATKEVPQAGGRTATTCFGFVEFVRPDAVENAIMNYHRKPIDGHIIKVERKRTRTFNGSSYGTNSSQRGSFAGVSSTWHGGKGGNGHGNRLMDANTFVPPTAGLSTSFVPQGGNIGNIRAQDGIITSPIKADGSPRLSRTNARPYTQSITTSYAINDGSSSAAVAFATACNYTPDAQLPKLGDERMSGSRVTADDKSTNKRNEPKRDGKLSLNTGGKDGTEGLKSPLTLAEAATKSELLAHAVLQIESSEHFRELKGSTMIPHGAKDDSKTAQTPIESPMNPGARTPQPYGAESAATCYYPLIHPYPYSPYGFHPIQPLMANPMTPQGGPIMYNTFGQAYYSPTPYSDMFTMYPMMQQYPAAIVETPTRPSMSSNGIEDRNEVGKEAYGMLPETDKKKVGNGKENDF